MPATVQADRPRRQRHRLAQVARRMAALGLDPRRVADLKANAPRPDHLFNAFLQGAELALAEVRTTATR